MPSATFKSFSSVFSEGRAYLVAPSVHGPGMPATGNEKKTAAVGRVFIMSDDQATVQARFQFGSEKLSAEKPEDKSATGTLYVHLDSERFNAVKSEFEKASAAVTIIWETSASGEVQLQTIGNEKFGS